MPQPTTTPISIFISYARADEAFKDRLLTTLTILQRQKLVKTWTDRQIDGGSDWRAAIDQALDDCHLALLLISPDFLASEFIQSVEMQRLMARRDSHGITVVPIIVRPCMWEFDGSSALQAWPADGKAIITFPEHDGARDQVWLEIGREIAALAKAFLQRQTLAGRADASNPRVAPANPPLSVLASTPTQDNFRLSLFDLDEKGWQSLQQQDVAKYFQQATAKLKPPYLWHESAQGFFDLCIGTTFSGYDLLLRISAVIRKLALDNPDTPHLHEPTRQVLLALFVVAIERLVSEEEVGVLPTNGDGGIRLALDQQHLVYYVTAAIFKLKSRLSPGKTVAALIVPIAPEEMDQTDLLAPARAAIANVYRGLDAVSPTPSSRFILGIRQELEDVLGSAPILGALVGKKSALLDQEVQRQALKELGLHTVAFGDAGQCSKELRELANDLENILHRLHPIFYPQPNNPPGDTTMSTTIQPKTEAQAQPNITYNFHAPVGAVGNDNISAQANAQQSQAAVGDIHNQGANTASFETLLNAFLSQSQSLALSPKKQANLAQKASELQTLAAQPERGAEQSRQVKTLLDDMDAVIDGVDKAEQVIGKLETVKNFFIAYWPLVAQLFTPGAPS